MKPGMKNYLFYSFLLVFLASCSGTKSLQSILPKSTCSQEMEYSVKEIPRPFHELNPDTALTARFSTASLNAANAIGLIETLTEYIRLKKQAGNSLEKRIQLLELSQLVSQRINLSSLEISAVASEMDCEEERITQIAEYMRNLEGDKESKLTVAAIIAGASGAITSGIVLSSNKVSSKLDYVGIASGIAEAVIGMLILNNKRKIDYTHERNPLREVWEGKQAEDSAFPPVVWYYITYENPALTGEKSIRTQIIERWKNFNELQPKKIAKYFGTGGKYSTEELYNRANMYDLLESYIKLIKQDLTSLSIEFDGAK